MIRQHVVFVACVVLLASSAIASSSNDPLSELTGVLKRTKGDFLVIDGSLNTIMLQSPDLKRLADGTRLCVRGRIKSELIDPTGPGPHAFPKQWQVFMQVEELIVTSERFERPKESRTKDATANSRNSPGFISSADLTGSFPKKKIVGPLGGLPLGEYMTIEGKPCAVGFGGIVKSQSLEEISNAGVHSLEVYRVNGVELQAPVIITFTRSAKFKPANYYAVRGYQTGEFGPANLDPHDPEASVPQTNYQFWIRFVDTKDVTKDRKEKINKAPEESR
jgi:hypothetical protein